MSQLDEPLTESVRPNPIKAGHYHDHVKRLPRVSQGRRPSGLMRVDNEDFQVDETLSFEPSGEGEHLFLLVEKQGCNTDWVARELQSHFNLRSQDVGYAGKKDRYSISRQWFSLHLPGKAVSVDDIDNPEFKVVAHTRHNKKLRTGSIASNHFKIRLKGLSEPIDSQALERLVKQGFPNYFGEQRFGHRGDNLAKAEAVLTSKMKVRSRNKRGIYLSAARSYLFNLIVGQRVTDNSWNRAIEGDCFNLEASRSFFVAESIDEALVERVESGDIHPSGWLAGRQASEAQCAALALEQSVLADYHHWLAGLNLLRVDSARRAMRVMAKDLQMHVHSPTEVTLSFGLPSGSFATALLRELIDFEDRAGYREPVDG